jgi:hypothetical protein
MRFGDVFSDQLWVVASAVVTIHIERSAYSNIVDIEGVVIISLGKLVSVFPLKLEVAR